MKIAYLISHDISQNDGVVKKIKDQISSWTALGHDVEMFCIVPHLNDLKLEGRYYPLTNVLKDRFFSNPELIQDLSSFSPDIVYVRNFVWTKSLDSIAKLFPTVLEVNTLESEEYKARVFTEKSIKSVFRYLALMLSSKLLNAKISGVVGVTNEILNSLNTGLSTNCLKVIPNSVDLDKPVFSENKKKELIKKRKSLFFIGSAGQSWHGVDFIIEMATKFSEYDFHIVGTSAKSTLSNVYYHGYLNKEKYLPILLNSQICIGSLALFRNNMKEACPLKVREYLGHGFPVIIGYEETAFMEGRPNYVHYVDFEGNVEWRSLKDFIEKMGEYIVPDLDVEEYISAKCVEKKRMGFLESLLHKNDN